MFGIRKKKKEESVINTHASLTSVTFPSLYHEHSKTLEDLYYKVKNIEKDFYSNDKHVISCIFLPSSYFTDNELIFVIKRSIQDLLDNEFVKTDFVTYKVNGNEIDTKNSKIEELDNGNLRVTKFSEKEVVVENYSAWSALYKTKRKIDTKTIKELKQIKKKIEAFDK